MESLDLFKQQFNFRQAGAFQVGVERECFITDGGGNIVPAAPAVIDYVQRNGWRGRNEPEVRIHPAEALGYELSACQLETRIGPCRITELAGALAWPDRELADSLRQLGLQALYLEVAPDDMPLDVYPDPSGRYARIVETMSRERLLAACQVTGTHVHIGMPDHETALRVYNHVIGRCTELCEQGDGSSGRRLAIYRKVELNPEPPSYESWEDFFSKALLKKFADNPRDCWTLIRVSIHGTIEFRMFGSTSSLERIEEWANRCLELCVESAR